MIEYVQEYEDEIRSIIKNNPKNFIRVLASKGLKKTSKNNSYLVDYIKSCTPLLEDSFYTLKTRIYWTLNRIQDFPLCKNDKNGIHKMTAVNVKNLNVGYPQYCNTKCQHEAPAYFETLKNSILSKYGVENAFCIETVKSRLAENKISIQSKREETYHAHFGDAKGWNLEKSLKTRRAKYGSAWNLDAVKYAKQKKYKKPNWNNSNKAFKTKRVKGTLNSSSQEDIILALDLYSQFGEQSFNEFKTYSFPFTPISDNALMYEMSRLTTEQTKDQTPSKTIRSFHKSMYSARRRNMLSPIDYWEHLKKDENLTNGNWKDFFINRYMYANTKDAETFRQTGNMTPKMVLGGLTVTHRADTVSYLKPMLAKRLVSTYLADATEVFCPFNGFSGIMLGTAYGCNKRFIGQDINAIQIDESKSIVSNLSRLGYSADITLSAADSIATYGKYDTLFCCPPYSDIEQWNFDTTGNCIDKDMTCDEWIDICLDKYDCRRYLFVVDDRLTVKYKTNAVEELTNSSHFGSNSELVVLIER